MKKEVVKKVSSPAEDLFVQLFLELFGAHHNEELYVQYPFVDIYGHHRFIDFALQSEDMKIAIEIDGETYHNPKKVSDDKYFDDLLKQNSLIHQNWKVFRWAYKQLKNTPQRVKDELLTFLGEYPQLKQLENFLPQQKGNVFELKNHQKEALHNLQEMRKNGQTIALLYHATGTGKTLSAALDAKSCNGRTLFLVHSLNLISQAMDTFASVWPEATQGQFSGQNKDKTQKVIFATMQSLSKHLKEFKVDDFDYLIIDECHHAPASSYQSILAYFKPKFILGLSATPQRSDGVDLLEMFCNVAHKMDLQTAVEQGELVPISCLRVKTDIDLSKVRINGVKYNSLDLESKLFIPSRNELIANTYLNYVKNKKTVVFCASVEHANLIADILVEKGINARAISGSDSLKYREEVLDQYEHGDIDVLCACDLLNEGWDSPRTEVLFMARPTMSKTIYMQQIGRGTRKSPGKDHLLVVDFVDNANMFNTPYSCHRLLNLAQYCPGELVLAPAGMLKKEREKFIQGEKPERIIDWPIDIFDFEVIDLFRWQDKVKDMISEMEFVRSVNVQAETINKYIKEEKIIPDFVVEFSQNKKFSYFYETSINKYCKQFNWQKITSTNIKELFFDFIKKMDMSFSYKPVLLKAIIKNIKVDGKIELSSIVDYFIEFYAYRKNNGLIVEKPNSIYCKEEVSRKEIENNIIANPFKRFADMRFLKRCVDIEFIEINSVIFHQLTNSDFEWLEEYCDEKLAEYFARIEKTA